MLNFLNLKSKARHLFFGQHLASAYCVFAFANFRQLYLHFTYSSIMRNGLEIVKYSQDCTFFKFYLACYNFFASYTCVIVFFIILCTTKKNEKTQRLFIQRGREGVVGYVFDYQTGKTEKKSFFKTQLFCIFFFISSLFCFSLYDYVWIVAYYVCI